MKCDICKRNVKGNWCDCEKDAHLMYWDYDDYEDLSWEEFRKVKKKVDEEWNAWDDWKEKKKRIDKINEALGEGKNIIGDFIEKKNK